MITADLTTRTALVTGGASGIGLATVRRLASCGARVAINDRAENPRLAEAEAQLKADGLDVIAVPGSVGDPKEAAAVVEAAVGGSAGSTTWSTMPALPRPIRRSRRGA